MTQKDALIRLLELSDEQWGQYALTRDPLWSRLTKAGRTETVRQAQHVGRRMAAEIAERQHSRDPEYLCGICGITIEEESELNGFGLYLFAQFQEPDGICLYEKTVQAAENYVQQNLPDRFQCPARQIVLAHELFHVLEFQSPDLPIHGMTVPILKFGRRSWRRKLTAPSEIAAMSFAKALINAPFYPQALDVLLMCALKQKEAEKLIINILRTFGGEGERQNGYVPN